MVSAYVCTQNVQDYRVISVKYDENYPVAHQIFFKAHKVKQPCPEKPNLRTLFLTNIPTWATTKSIRSIFKVNGKIDEIYFQMNPSSGPPPEQFRNGPFGDDSNVKLGNGFKYAYIVFERSSGVNNAMKIMDTSKVFTLYNEKTLPEMGLSKWRQDYNNSISMNTDRLTEIIEEGVAKLDAEKEAQKKQAEEEVEEADEEGWVTVTKHTSKKPLGKINTKAQAKMKAREARKRKRNELENFYRYQMKERKISKLNELKEKFEADKQKQIKMKLERKFKPN